MNAKEVKTEADWAMMYAEERKLRMKCQERLASFMCNGASLANTAKNFGLFTINATQDDREWLVKIVTIIQESDDLLADISMNIFDPLWSLPQESLDILRKAKCVEDIPNEVMRIVSAFIETGAKNTQEEWHELCHERGIKCRSEVNAESEEQFNREVERRMHDENVKNLDTHS